MRRRPFNGIPLQHILHEYHRFLTGIRYQHAQRSPGEIWKFEIHSGRQLITFRPIVLLRRADHGANFKNLVDFAFPGEKWPERVQFGHDATYRPNIDRAVVGRRME